MALQNNFLYFRVEFYMARILILSTLLILTSCTRPPLPPPIVLFDQAHGNLSLVDNRSEFGLSKLAAQFINKGFSVKSSTSALTSEQLTNVSTLVIASPTQPLAQQEIKAIKQYLVEGGQLCILIDQAQPLAKLLARIDIAISNDLIREQQNTLPNAPTTSFFVTNLIPHPLTTDLSSININGSFALQPRLAANRIARTSQTAWVDLNNNQTLEMGDAKQAFSVIVTGQIGHGHFVIFADADILVNNTINGKNLILAHNLTKWLKSGTYTSFR